MINELEDVIDKKVRPYLKDHNGDVKLISFQDGVLRVKLLGNCGNCPLSRITLEDVISKELKQNFECIKNVVVDDDISEETLNFVRKLLSKNKSDHQNFNDD